jgi:hypothetical protein
MEFDEAANNVLIAATPSKLYDVSSAGAGSELATGFTNGRWQWVPFSNSAGNWICFVNGADGFWTYDGSAIAEQTLTTVTADNCVAIANHMQRIWLVEENSLDAYYLATNAISGAGTKYNFSYEFVRGGKIMALGSWTRDGGSGPDDLFVVLASTGECLIYSGTDPSSANTWARVGRFQLPRPIGRRCLAKYGADLLVLTEQGLLSMADIMAKADSQQSANAVTDKISNAFKLTASAYGTQFGWQVVEYPAQNLLIINIPTEERASAEQFVMNTRTGAWARWTGIDVGCWGRLSSEIYAGTSVSTTVQYGEALMDDNEAIEALCVQAYNAFGDPKRKRFLRVRPQLRKSIDYKPLVRLLFEFDPNRPDVTAPVAVASGPTWDEVYWDVEFWGGQTTSTFNWLAINGHGVAAALVIASSSETPIVYNGGLIAYEAGGIY